MAASSAIRRQRCSTGAGLGVAALGHPVAGDALYRGADLLILDEPTAVLTPQEVDEFFVTLKQMASEGHSLIFISHKLHEVVHISDRVTVLRDGKMVGSVPTAETTRR